MTTKNKTEAKANETEAKAANPATNEPQDLSYFGKAAVADFDKSVAFRSSSGIKAIAALYYGVVYDLIDRETLRRFAADYNNATDSAEVKAARKEAIERVAGRVFGLTGTEEDDDGTTKNRAPDQAFISLARRAAKVSLRAVNMHDAAGPGSAHLIEAGRNSKGTPYVKISNRLNPLYKPEHGDYEALVSYLDHPQRHGRNASHSFEKLVGAAIAAETEAKGGKEAVRERKRQEARTNLTKTLKGAGTSNALAAVQSFAASLDGHNLSKEIQSDAIAAVQALQAAIGVTDGAQTDIEMRVKITDADLPQILSAARDELSDETDNYTPETVDLIFSIHRLTAAIVDRLSKKGIRAKAA